jgi:hypothetical protein
MRNKLIALLLASITVGSASASGAGLVGGNTFAIQTNPAAGQVAIGDGGVTNRFQPGAAIDEAGLFDLQPLIGEASELSVKPRLTDSMTLEAGVGWSFVDPDSAQRQADALIEEFYLLRADSYGTPFYLGGSHEITFVESHTYRAGIPAPVRLSYPVPLRRFELFGEVAPILDAAPGSYLGWGIGIGVRIYLGR